MYVPGSCCDGGIPVGRAQNVGATVRPADPVRAAIQESLDAQGDGWQVAHYVVVAGLERITGDRMDLGATTIITPVGQPDYLTEGLVNRYWDESDDE
ncbi:hypothetical protein PBI_VELVETEEN_31 [Mycobacterium phage Velveteen]|uniref:hypothetical protein n=1 Tax=Mycobacterium phage Velveteen TaxID=1340821 RepID=UPI00038812A3|nr:hypothetical protein N858_gp031 [Mycobacterium phage Velveteen]YP_009125885.1 hypothetical protein VC45_gp032 [Mycobacterium phage Cerasum]AVR76426.1 hypothetical protein SEA_BIGPHIL_32 [Mycobacterium phage BigPhil]QZD98515.1 hypothetical protein SEA_SARMA624_32 [Mycobacterium phage Sarma624]AGT12238.1 hypothetical protein PBI_VELVETEEN_31 [Mycobacterium phage Velveteen]AIK67434.1 hypothetical protein PBI_CERASUM_32 [Mycobacterium phage Cerasum]